jgi:glycosyltransferase involved in cell wall biosynthesis
MHVVILSWRDLAHPQAGGSEVLLDRMARGLMDHGHEVTMVCGGPVEPRPYRVVENGGRYTQYLRAPFAARRAVAHADVVVDVENGIPFFAPMWERRPTLCMVHHVHRDQWRQHFPRPVAKVGWTLEQFGLKRAHRRSTFLTVSDSTAQSLEEMGVDGDRIRVARIGIQVPESLPTKSEEPLFVVLSRLVPHKRIELILEAWKEVRPHTGGRLAIIGDGPQRELLESQAPEGVEFCGYVDEDRKHELLSSAWLLLHAAHHEGWGIAIIEAAARNTPAIAFDAPGVRDAIVQNTTGVLVTNVHEMSEAWRRLAADPKRRHALARAARKRARTFTWAGTIDTLCSTLESVARQSPRGSRRGAGTRPSRRAAVVHRGIPG